MDLFANYVEFAKFCQLNKVIHNKTDRMDSTKMENSQWLAGIKRFFLSPFLQRPSHLAGALVDSRCGVSIDQDLQVQ